MGSKIVFPLPSSSMAVLFSPYVVGLVLCSTAFSSHSSILPASKDCFGWFPSAVDGSSRNAVSAVVTGEWLFPFIGPCRSSGLTVGVGVFALKKPMSVLCDGPGPVFEDGCLARAALAFFGGLVYGADCSARRLGTGDVCDNAGSVAVD